MFQKCSSKLKINESTNIMVIITLKGKRQTVGVTYKKPVHLRFLYAFIKYLVTT